MIDRTRRNLLLHPVFLLSGIGLAGILGLLSLRSDSAMGPWPALVLAATLAGPVLVLTTVALLRSRSLMDRSLYRICYTCPKCSRTGLPAFRCSGCKMAHADLQPSLHGVFYARCGTPNCGRLLPTVNFLGRRKLDKVCPKCGADLTHVALGWASEYRVAIIGATSSGKTNLMITAVWQLETVFAPANGFRLTFASSDEEKAYRLLVARLASGQPLDKTLPVPIPQAFSLSLTDDGGEQSCLLYLYDAAGEDFADEQVLGGHPLDSYDALLFVLDPFSEEGVAQGALGSLDQAEVSRAHASGTQAGFITARMVNALEKRLGVPPGGVFRVPVAVVVTKLDVCGLGARQGIGARELDRPFASFTAAVTRAEHDHHRVRDLLVKIGLSNVVQLLEQRFQETCYFGASPLGRSLDYADRSAFRPRGVLAPVVWLCDRTNALGDVDPFDVLFINSHVYWMRAMRGMEGRAMRLYAWLGLGAGALGVVAFFLALPWLLFILTCGITIVPLTLLYLYLAYVLVHRR